ncbi:hypothetical protein [Acanthopleuribacter pedis]|uniref:Uncharacterized protein n=1 Tax=Acanthopleuribacter pedis TaxID=442870 RepID=A0A8J7Q1S1_9BACT|nr:hypothetical protein [Acanthopleuribacter pedis]MBO1318862.1 hypothetical protein [Acanthopleuribacter pedis]
MNFALVLLCLTGLLQKPTTNRELPVRQASTLRLIKTDHFQLFHHKRYLQEAQALALEGERFIEDLERQWAVVLPDERITVSLLTQTDPERSFHHLADNGMLNVIYRKRARRIELHVTRAGMEHITQEQLNQNLRHYLVHVYLDQWEPDRLPFFLAEGLAHFYDQNPLPTYTYNLILGFNHLKKNTAPADLTEAGFFQNNQGPTYTAMANLFVTELWRDYPESEVVFMQRHLVGQPLNLTLMNARLQDFPTLLNRFIETNSDLYPMARLVKTADFWAIIFGIMFLIAATIHVVISAREAMMQHVELVEEVVPEILPASERAPIPPTRRQMTPPRRDPETGTARYPLPDTAQGGTAGADQDQDQDPYPTPPTAHPEDDLFAAQSAEAIVFLDEPDRRVPERTAPPVAPVTEPEAPMVIDEAEGALPPVPSLPPRMKPTAPQAQPPRAKPAPRRSAAPKPETTPAKVAPPPKGQPRAATPGAAPITPPARASASDARGVTPPPPTRPPATAPPAADAEFTWDLDELEDDLDSAFDLLGGKDS